MKRFGGFERLTAPQRRRFLKLLGVALAAPAVPSALRYALNDTLAGEAYAQAQEQALPSYFIEINYRDQVDLGEVFVAPGLATCTNLIRGESGRAAAMFYQMNELTQKTVPNTASQPIYLSPDSMMLEPHLDSIAMVDCMELTPGAIHYHNAANYCRIPDADYTKQPGYSAVFANDPTSDFPTGCEEFYGTLATPASLHNYLQKRITPGLKNGVVLKGITRPKITCYHYAGGLEGAELDRMQNKDQLFSSFPMTQGEAIRHLPTPEEAQLFSNLLRRVDPTFLKRQRFSDGVVAGHDKDVVDAQSLLYSDTVRDISLPLTEQEIAYWKPGVPESDQTTVDGQVEKLMNTRFQIWEQYAFAYKLISSGVTRTVALECEFVDVHDRRSRAQMRIHSQQFAPPLARLIESLKAAGVYDRTLIAIYTTDGSRSPAAGSAGNEGKNTLVLAGGKINGGYFGDVTVTGNDGNGHKYGFKAPDPLTGLPMAAHENNTGRLPGGHAWQTVAKAFGTPASVLSRFQSPRVTATAPLSFLLRA
jgi:hypothetical protein